MHSHRARPQSRVSELVVTEPCSVLGGASATAETSVLLVSTLLRALWCPR